MFTHMICGKYIVNKLSHGNTNVVWSYKISKLVFPLLASIHIEIYYDTSIVRLFINDNLKIVWKLHKVIVCCKMQEASNNAYVSVNTRTFVLRLRSDRVTHRCRMNRTLTNQVTCTNTQRNSYLIACPCRNLFDLRYSLGTNIYILQSFGITGKTD